MICINCGKKFSCSLKCKLEISNFDTDYSNPTRCLCLSCRVIVDPPTFIREEHKNNYLEYLFKKCKECYNISYKEFISNLIWITMKCARCGEYFTCTLICNTESKICICSKCALESTKRFLVFIKIFARANKENLEHAKRQKYSFLMSCYTKILKEIVIDEL